MSTIRLAKVARHGRAGLVATALAALLALGSAGDANAALSTDTIFVPAQQRAVCTATNAGTNRIEVTVDVIEPFNESVNGPVTCSLGPQEFCLQEILSIQGRDRFLFCRVTASSGKIRSVLMNTTSGITSQAR